MRLLTDKYLDDPALRTECDRITNWLQTSDVYNELMGWRSSQSRAPN
jgi:hypothetical protein